MVCEALRFLGLEDFDPRYKVKTKRCIEQRRQPISKAIFPGYVFARFDLDNLEQRHRVITVPGVLRIVGYGDEPLAIPDSEIESIRVLVASGLQLTPEAPVHVTPGELIRVTKGPLAGMEGVVVLVKGSRRVIVSIGMLNRGVSAEIDAACLESAA